jgi:predicted TIM-barrel fold metal-dependent hydrolase
VKIDAFPHILPEAFFKRAQQVATGPGRFQLATHPARPALYDLNARFRIMDQFEDYAQILTLSLPSIEELTDGPQANELARLANDGMAELVAKHPDRFLAFAATVSLYDVDSALIELDRAIGQLGAVGVQIFTNVNGIPMDDPRFEPLFARMAELDKTIWVHPSRPVTVADYPGEDRSKFGLHLVFGWPYETALFSSRIIFAGVLERHPNLRILTHHAGGMVPHFSGRIEEQLEDHNRTTPQRQALTGPLIDQFRRFYGDTALSGAPHALHCAAEFYGIDRLVFGTDMPFGSEQGRSFVSKAIADIDGMEIDAEQRNLIYEGNLRHMLGI